MVPKQFHRWLKVFGKVESERMLVRKVWDHAIDVKEDFKPSKAKVYLLSRNEREEVQKFVDEHLKKGYIRPSKLQQTSPVFFVESFEPVVMFFGMTNLPATFQAMMNKILRDMINEGKVVAFVDDVLVGTEAEEGHDEVVEEVLR